ncbi:MAG: hypothetical protein K940chlam2_01269, partial [Chlamydiae bacterium]|nr:hypothetical protein [Chlamydiota bacterium]
MGEKSACGVGLLGKLNGENLLQSEKYAFELLYTDSVKEMEERIRSTNPRAVIYNYHFFTSPWIEDSRLRRKFSNIVHVMLHHDVTQQMINTYKPRKNFGFKYMVTANPTLKGSNNVFLVNRLAPPFKPKPYVDSGIPKIGFHGFGVPHKGIHRIAKKVQEEFDEAIIRLHIPPSYYGDPDGNLARCRVAEVMGIIKKPATKVETSFDFSPPEKVVEFLGENTINCYFYDPLPGYGLASSPDYAVAARRPIAVTKSHQLRNFIGLTPSICIEDNSLKDIISFGVEPLQKLYAA